MDTQTREQWQVNRFTTPAGETETPGHPIFEVENESRPLLNHHMGTENLYNSLSSFTFNSSV